MNFNLQRLQELFEIEGQKTKAIKIYCKEQGIEFNENVRKRASEKLSTPPQEKALDNETDTTTNQYANDKETKTFFMPSAWDGENNKFLSIDEFCTKYNLPKEQVRSSKLISHQMGHITYNIAFNASTEEENTLDFDFFDDLVQKYIVPVNIEIKAYGSNDFFDRLVYTDTHIGMSVDGGRNTVPLYDGEWDRQELLHRLDIMIAHTIEFKKGSVLYIDELGDFCDGLFGYTTRGGHELPQNMNDKEVFELGVLFKMKLIEGLLPHYQKIVCNSIIADNHSFMFAYFVNSAVKKIVESKYADNVEYNILDKFINHYSEGKHTLVLSHGKENEALKFGFKPILDRKQADKIDQYCKEYKLYNGNYIEFSKGDSHQAMSDFSTSNDFAYCNYPAFSPPSNWVKTNFSLSREGFSFFNIGYNSNIKVHIPYWFR